MYDGNILHSKKCLGLSDALFCVQGCMFVYFDWNVLLTPCVWHCPVFLFFIFCCIWDWLIDSMRVFMYAGNGVDVCWQLPLVGMGRTLLSLSFPTPFLYAKPVTVAPYRLCHAKCMSRLCRVKLCVCVCVCGVCSSNSVYETQLSVGGQSLSLSRALSLLSVCLSVCPSLSGCWRWQKWNALPVLCVKLPCCWFSCAIRTV